MDFTTLARARSVVNLNGICTDFGNCVRGKIAFLSRLARRDLTIALMLFVMAGYSSYQMSQRIDPVIFEIATLNIWFDADIPRIFVDMNYRDSEDITTHRHPLIPLIEYPPVYLLKKVFGFPPETSVRITIAAVASLWLGGFFVVLRLIDCRRLDALLFSLLAVSSASAMFWLVVPETVLFGSLSLLCALGLVAFAQRRPVSAVWYVAVSAATLSTTVTNWMFGLLATVVGRPWKRSSQITANAFCLVVVLWMIQKLIFPSADFFFGTSAVDFPETEAGGMLPVLRSFFFHTIIMPAIAITHWAVRPNLAVMTVEPSLPGSAGLWGAGAVFAWVVLLGQGLWAFWTIRESGKLRIFLGLGLIGQLALHLLFGRETFFYSLHFLPLLIVFTALSTFTRLRPLTLILAAMVTVFGGINNTFQFAKAVEFVHTEVTEADKLRAAIKARPDEPWPRGAKHVLLTRSGRATNDRQWESWEQGTGHVVLALPGSKESDKGYHEPGGGFSPAVGSFGVSIWITDAKGNLKTTSDSMPVNLFRQSFIWDDRARIPGIVTDSVYYRAQWSSAGPGAWVLSLATQPRAETQPAIVVRSVGPAGGPIHSLEHKGQRLIVNNRWALSITPMPTAIHVGEEGQKGWMTARSDITRWHGQSGWGYAKLELAQGENYKLLVTDLNHTHLAAKVFSEYSSPLQGLQVKLPDDRFAASLHAQIAHLLMGLVGDEARPGDPMSYPLAWLCDQAYTTVALARSGQLTIAKQLSKHLAENDFFGGFGAEADAPGVAIWALTDVAMQINQPEYIEWLWPHIRRKAEIILEMLSSDRAIHKRVSTPVIPLYTKPLPSADPDVTLLSEPSQAGLIVGRVENSRPVLYVNAVSYLGLLDAAVVADRVGQHGFARQWRAKASELKQAWTRKFEGKLFHDNLTYTSGLWPAGIVNRHSQTFLSGLEARWLDYAKSNFWQPERRSVFKVAEAHQWLFVGQPERAWVTLAAFWQHQKSPGLYSWGIESSKENTFNRWKQIRGWLNPQEDIDYSIKPRIGEPVTPFYRTAAEILLLQLDMLAYVDQSASEPTLIIGAGIQPSWLDQPMRVRHLSTGLGAVDWTWDGREMRVKVRGRRAAVRLGAGFSANTPLHVEYVSS